MNGVPHGNNLTDGASSIRFENHEEGVGVVNGIRVRGSAKTPQTSEVVGLKGETDNAAHEDQRAGAGGIDTTSTRPPSDWSENSNIPERNLGFFQILSLIINSVIGTGIFTQPGYILSLTKSKPIALGLWAVGGVYTAITLLIFLEYGTALPYNGGPMVYLDNCFNRPKLLVLIIFSFHRIILGTSESNCRTLALNLLSLANPNTPTSHFSNGLISFVSVVVILVVCLMIYFFRRLCFLLNTSFALYKLMLITVLAIAGLAALKGDYQGLSDFEDKQAGFDSVTAAHGLIYVIYSYQGFLNVNCIAGEIKEAKRNMKWAAVVSIILITIFYMFFTTVLYTVLDYSDLTSEVGNSDAAVVLAQKVFHGDTGVRACIALSGFGTLLVQVYTIARVKQAIAWRRVIPFYKFIGKQDPQFDSPGGGLVLQAVFTCIPLLAFHNSSSNVRSFVTGIYTWGHQLIIVFLGLGLLRLRQRMRQIWPNWDYTYLTNWLTLYTASLGFAASNGVILVLTALPNDPGDIPRYNWVVITAGLIGVASLYWGALRLLTIPIGSSQRTLGSMIGFQPIIHDLDLEQESDDVLFMKWEARQEGAFRFVEYKVSGFTKKLQDRWQWFIGFIFRHFG